MLYHMKKCGILIVNAFIGGAGFTDAYERLCAAMRRRGVSLVLKTNAELLLDASSGGLLSAVRPDFAILWDKDVRLGLQLERMGVRLYNSARAVAVCDDKALTHIALGGKLPMPKTVVAPFTYPNAGYGGFSFLREAEKHLSYPLVIKECFGSYGAQVYLARSAAEAEAILIKTAERPVLLQEFIAESAGTDIRVIVVGDRAVAAMRRTNRADFRANLANGGTAQSHTLSAEEEALAVSASRELKLDFCGVDLLLSKSGPLLCEVNSNAQFKGILSCTGVDAAEHIAEHVLLKEGLL